MSRRKRPPRMRVLAASRSGSRGACARSSRGTRRTDTRGGRARVATRQQPCLLPAVALKERGVVLHADGTAPIRRCFISPARARAGRAAPARASVRRAARRRLLDFGEPLAGSPDAQPRLGARVREPGRDRLEALAPLHVLRVALPCRRDAAVERGGRLLADVGEERLERRLGARAIDCGHGSEQLEEDNAQAKGVCRVRAVQ
mmetsp:Transcript_20297/g.50777  ORF Transcript_20297/g.50777 Transcript_20297/m.50777 type:complete len:203 (+) Transcript_20297:399-1007(+)